MIQELLEKHPLPWQTRVSASGSFVYLVDARGRDVAGINWEIKDNGADEEETVDMLLSHINSARAKNESKYETLRRRLRESVHDLAFFGRVEKSEPESAFARERLISCAHALHLERCLDRSEAR